MGKLVLLKRPTPAPTFGCFLQTTDANNLDLQHRQPPSTYLGLPFFFVGVGMGVSLELEDSSEEAEASEACSADNPLRFFVLLPDVRFFAACFLERLGCNVRGRQRGKNKTRDSKK